MRYRSRSLVMLLITAIAAVAYPQSLPADFDQYISRSLEAFKVPGASVAIVKDGKVLMAKGFGVAHLGKGDPVTANTLFGIASNSKAFTSTALAILVDQGKIAWDDPVQKYLPAFQLSDPYVSHEITIRDLLVHRSGLGLGGGDLLWWPQATYSASEIVHRLRYVPLKTSFRSAYAYDNVLYLVAGQLIQAVTGKQWKDFVADEILRKVGMDSTTTTYAAALASGRLSGTHALVEGSLVPVPPLTQDITGPAGGINSTANDMAKWMLVQLAQGRLANGSSLFTPERSRDLWAIVTPIPIDPPAKDNPAPELDLTIPKFRGYALGFGVSDYRGHRRLSHWGGLPGFVSYVCMMPDDNAGIVILTNHEAFGDISSIGNSALDSLLGLSKIDWLTAYQKSEAAEGSDLAERRQNSEASRNKNSRPSLPLTQYAGTYSDKWYGDVRIEKEGEKLVLRMVPTPMMVGELQHWHYDTFVVRWRDRSLRADAFITFTLDEKGDVVSAKMKPFDSLVDFSFDYGDLHLFKRR